MGQMLTRVVVETLMAWLLVVMTMAKSTSSPTQFGNLR